MCIKYEIVPLVEGWIMMISLRTVRFYVVLTQECHA